MRLHQDLGDRLRRSFWAGMHGYYVAEKNGYMP